MQLFCTRREEGAKVTLRGAELTREGKLFLKATDELRGVRDF